MVKSCCAIGCYNKYSKGGVSFYRFPTDREKRNKWISAVKRKDWEPNEYTWLCSAHFISGVKSNDPLSPDYVPSIFSFSTSTQKLRFQQQLDDYERRRNMNKTRLDCMPIEGAVVKVETKRNQKRKETKQENQNIHEIS